MIEVEKRSFINEYLYNELLKVFKDNIKTTKQITYYFDCDQDFRIMFMKEKIKLWLKEGIIHDDVRKEHEVLIDKKYDKTLLDMLYLLGYKVKIKWFRIRNEFMYNDINFTLDYTKGYGYIIEGEILVDNEEEIEKAKDKIEKAFANLDIVISGKEEFKTKYEDYCLNWEHYTKDIDEDSFFE